MSRIILLLVVTLTFCEAGIVDRFKTWWSGEPEATWPPSFCNGLDCPKYQVVETTSDYEVRRYDLSHWVSTKTSDMDMDQVKGRMFMKLFGYISGSNSKGQKIAMTAPVPMLVKPGQGPACESNFTMSFFIADSITDPPAPQNPQVFLEQSPERVLYVRSFGGYAKEADYMAEARNLAQALPDRLKYVEGTYYVVGYDAPYKFWNRHNEVWFIAM